MLGVSVQRRLEDCSVSDLVSLLESEVGFIYEENYYKVDEVDHGETEIAVTKRLAFIVKVFSSNLYLTRQLFGKVKETLRGGIDRHLTFITRAIFNVTDSNSGDLNLVGTLINENSPN